MNHVIEEAWPEWKPVRVLGEGGFSTVYLCTKQEHTVVASAAIKVISIPHDRNEYETKAAQLVTLERVQDYYRKSVDECVNEISILETIKGASNIVHIEDFKVVTRTDDFGWYILIRMELLSSLSDILKTRNLTYNDAIRLGVDICNALTVCHKNNILHRDIKPANIMISQNGGFKLADFGISLNNTNLSGSYSLGGTLQYMAPEVLRAEGCDTRSDIYSLGLVLYQLFNRNRPPFVNINSRTVSKEDRDKSIMCRQNGMQLPPPIDAGPMLANVILKACAFSPENRFASAEQMRQVLLDSQKMDEQNKVLQLVNNEIAEKKDKKGLFALGIVAALMTVAIIILLYNYFLG